MDFKELTKRVKTKEIRKISDIDKVVRESLKDMGFVKVNEHKVQSIVKLMEISYTQAKL
jgi:hypothetical protein